LEVRDENNGLLRGKGLLFQAKVNWHGMDRDLLSQSCNLCSFPNASLIINYTPNGYFAVPAEVVQRTEADHKALAAYGLPRLAEVLSKDYLYCAIGRPGLYYDPHTEVLHAPEGEPWTFGKDARLIQTLIRLLPMRGGEPARNLRE
jgi:hypothetical protein